MTKIDYAAVEREYITTDISIRKLAAKYEMAWSTIADYARNHDWSAKRIEYKATATKRELDRYSERYADTAAQARQEMVLTARATIARYAQQLSGQNPEKVTARDAAAMMDKLLLLLGDATERREEKHLGISITAAGGLDEPFLRRILELSRGHVTEQLEGDPEVRPPELGQD